MMAKILKSVIVVAAVLTFFGGTAMADRWGRDYHHHKRHHSHWKQHQRQYSHWRQHQKAREHYHNSYRHERHARVAPPRRDHRQPSHYASNGHPLAPRIVFFGGLPVPVPPPPNEVLDYLTGH